MNKRIIIISDNLADLGDRVSEEEIQILLPIAHLLIPELFPDGKQQHGGRAEEGARHPETGAKTAGPEAGGDS